MITVKLFAILKDKAGRNELPMNNGPATVAELLQAVAAAYPALSDIIAGGRIMVSVNREFAKRDAPVKDGDEVALMPPFSGGDTEPAQRVRVQREPFDVNQEIERIKKTSTSIGAVVAF